MKLSKLNPLNKLSDGAIGKLANMVPDELIIKEVKKQWFKNTLCLDKFPAQKEKIKGLMTEGTKKIKYKQKTAFNWLKELEQTNKLTKEQKQFIVWFQVDYPIESFELMKKQK